MNHNFGRDLLALDRLLPLPLRYVGLLGPQKRYAELLARLSEYRPLDFEEAGTRNLYAPAGLDIGSEAPKKSRSRLPPRSPQSFPVATAVTCASAKVIFTQPSPWQAEKPLSSTPRLWTAQSEYARPRP